MSRPLKFEKGKICYHPRFGEVKMIQWVGRNGMSCIVETRDGNESFIKDHLYCELTLKRKEKEQ